jgi:hypothetical protein
MMTTLAHAGFVDFTAARNDQPSGPGQTIRASANGEAALGSNDINGQKLKPEGYHRGSTTSSASHQPARWHS